MKVQYFSQIIVLGLLGLLMVILSACTSQVPITTSGFLGDYSSLQPDPEMKGIFLYMNPEKSPEVWAGEYSRFMIGPVIIYFHPEAKGRGIDPAQLKGLADYFKIELRDVFEDSYRLVNRSGQGVALIRVAITDVVPVKGALNKESNEAKSGIGLGKASMEAEIIDSKSGERIAAVLDSRKGKGFKQEVGVTDWEYTKYVLRQWVILLKKEIDLFYGK